MVSLRPLRMMSPELPGFPELIGLTSRIGRILSRPRGTEGRSARVGRRVSLAWYEIVGVRSATVRLRRGRRS
jgi:hypothetical protein